MSEVGVPHRATAGVWICSGSILMNFLAFHLKTDEAVLWAGTRWSTQKSVSSALGPCGSCVVTLLQCEGRNTARPNLFCSLVVRPGSERYGLKLCQAELCDVLRHVSALWSEEGIWMHSMFVTFYQLPLGSCSFCASCFWKSKNWRGLTRYTWNLG